MELINDQDLRKYAIRTKKEVYEPRSAQDNDLLQAAKLEMYEAEYVYRDAKKRYSENPSEANRQREQMCRGAYVKAYSSLVSDRLFSIYDQAHTSFQVRNTTYPWEGSECVVSHMIFTSDSVTNFDKPVYYVVRKFEQEKGPDLVGSFYKSIGQGDYVRKTTMINMLKTIAELLREQFKYLFLSHAEKDYGKKSQWDQHAATLIQCIESAELIGRLASKIDFAKHSQHNWDFKIYGGKMLVQITEATPVLSGLEQHNYPKKVQDMINAMFSDTKLASRVLLLKIDLVLGYKVTQHYLTLSEYDIDEMPLSIVYGLEKNWGNNGDGWDAEKTFSALATRTWRKLRCPAPEAVMINCMWEWLYTSVFAETEEWLTERNNETKVLKEKGKKLIETITNEWQGDTEDLDFSGLPARNFFFSADNLCAQLTFFNLEFVENRRLLNVYEESGNFVVGLFTRYPFVYYNLEHRYRLSKDAWKAEGMREKDQPQNYQRPTSIPRYDSKKVLDKHNRPTFPLQQIVQNDHMSYLEMLKRKLRREHVRITDDLDVPLDLPYYVNDLEDDENVVYMKMFHTQRTWDLMNLFRIEAETDVSRYMFDQGKMIFYEFRRTAENLERHPFRQYLKLYPEAKRKWQEVWREKQDLTQFVALKIDNGRYVRRDGQQQGSGRRQWRRQPAPAPQDLPDFPALPSRPRPPQPPPRRPEPAQPAPRRSEPAQPAHDAGSGQRRFVPAPRIPHDHYRYSNDDEGQNGFAHPDARGGQGDSSYEPEARPEREREPREPREPQPYQPDPVEFPPLHRGQPPRRRREPSPKHGPIFMRPERQSNVPIHHARSRGRKAQEDREKLRQEREREEKERVARTQKEQEEWLRELRNRKIMQDKEREERRVKQAIERRERAAREKKEREEREARGEFRDEQKERELLKEAERKARELARQRNAQKRSEQEQTDEGIVKNWLLRRTETVNYVANPDEINRIVRVVIELKKALNSSIYTALYRLEAPNFLDPNGLARLLQKARQLLKEARVYVRDQRFRELQRAGAERLREQQKKAVANARRREPKGRGRGGYGSDFDGRRENEQFLLRRLCGMCAAEAEPEV